MYFSIVTASGGYRAHLYSGGNLVWWTEVYTTKANARNAISVAQSSTSSTPVYDRT
jgi:uncharacterized protein YegP (UPF0339 family)